jgi:uncharacterized membrane protein (DUF106 family)
MKLVKFFLIVFVAGIILACTSAQEQAYKSEDAVHKQRLELVDKYQKCMKEANKDKEKEAVCEQYLKAAEALK